MKVDISSYATSPEILGYFKDIVETHHLGGFVKLNHRVLGAWWNNEVGEWKIKIQNGDNPNSIFYDTGHILINATGVLKYSTLSTRLLIDILLIFNQQLEMASRARG